MTEGGGCALGLLRWWGSGASTPGIMATRCGRTEAYDWLARGLSGKKVQGGFWAGLI
jgi:hypothetical protein